MILSFSKSSWFLKELRIATMPSACLDIWQWTIFIVQQDILSFVATVTILAEKNKQCHNSKKKCTGYDGHDYYPSTCSKHQTRLKQSNKPTVAGITVKIYKDSISSPDTHCRTFQKLLLDATVIQLSQYSSILFFFFFISFKFSYYPLALLHSHQKV